MLFSEPTFLFVFLPVMLGLYYVSPKAIRNLILLFGSLLFYGYGESKFVIVMLVSIAVNYGVGLGIGLASTRKRSAGVLLFGLACNLGMLLYFKYADFFVDNLNRLLGFASIDGVQLQPVHLPIGISFFTFQAMSYLIDVFRADAKLQRNPLNLGLYIALFPQLIAGPIVRYQQIADQIDKRSGSVEQFADGIRRFITGLGKKMIIANAVAFPVDQIFELPSSEISFSLAWFAMLCYSLQIYFDFSGYSDMAIGLGMMFGFRFAENFNYPYVSRSITEFWRRWHISLSSWFRDYLYIPLGGNRVPSLRIYRNLLIVFVLCGFWHGASWNFLVWGLLHGVFLIGERCLRSASKNVGAVSPLRHAYVLCVVLFSWVPFRSADLGQSIDFWRTLIGLGECRDATLRPIFSFCNLEVGLAIIVGVIGSTPIANTLFKKCRDQARQSGRFGSRHIEMAINAAALFVLLYCAMLMASGAYSPFIYFRF